MFKLILFNISNTFFYFHLPSQGKRIVGTEKSESKVLAFGAGTTASETVPVEVLGGFQS